MPLNRKILKTALLLLGAAILVFFLATVDFQEARKSLSAVSWWAFLILIAITAVNILLKAFRWKLLTSKITAVSIPLRFSFLSIIAGVSASSLIPGRVELAKPLLLKKEFGVPFSQSLSALFLERVLDLITLLLILLTSLYFVQNQAFFSPVLVLVLLAGLFFFTLVLTWFPRQLQKILTAIINKMPFSLPRKDKLNHFAEEVLQSFSIFKSKNTVLFFAFLSLAANFLEILRFFFLLQLLNLPISLALSGFAFTASILAGIISTVPGGMGITEFSASAILSSLAQSPLEMIKTAILIDRIISYYLLVLLGALLLIYQEKFLKNLTKYR